MKIFWSWQNDFAPKQNRWFILGALQDAVAQLEDEYELEPAERPEVDHDTKDEAGMVEITTAILEKIERSAAFVADMTPIAETADGKALPNPNVAIELGWALKMPGWRRMIAVINTASGYSPDDLPFDIRHRRALTYSLAEGADKPTRSRVAKALTKDLVGALRKNLEEHLDERSAEIVPKGVSPRSSDPSLWERAGEAVSYLDSLGRKGKSHFAIPAGPRAYARFIPASWTDCIPRVTEIEVLTGADAVQPSLAGVSDGDWGPCEEGFVRCWFTGPRAQEPREAGNVAMYFDETGEFWLTDTTALYLHEGRLTLGVRALVTSWGDALRTVNNAFDKLGASKVRTVEFGIVGLADAHWPANIESQARPARKNTFRFSRTARDWSRDAQLALLTEALDELHDIFGLPKPPAGQIAEIAKNYVRS